MVRIVLCVWCLVAQARLTGRERKDFFRASAVFSVSRTPRSRPSSTCFRSVLDIVSASFQFLVTMERSGF